MKKLIRFCGSYFLQFVLAIIAYFSWLEVDYFGNKTLELKGSLNKNTSNPFDREYADLIATDVDVTAGFDGGALAMGLICCVCIIMIVWIEINKNPKP